MLAQAIIGTAIYSGPTTPVVNPSLGVPINVLTSHPDYAIGFFRRDYNTGYFNDNTAWFATQTPSTSDYDGYINIGSSLDNLSIDNYSIEWTGYFIPPSNGNYMFRTTSDDASYMWLGLEALSGFTTGNPIVNNGGPHGQTTVTTTAQYAMTSNMAYPIRVQYGEATGGATMYAEFSLDGGNTWNHFINQCFRISSTSEGYLPLTSAFQVMNLDGSSYGGSGAWTDTISSKAFTLYNSPTWSNTNGGQFRFNSASSQYAGASSFSTLRNFTVQGVFKLHSLPPAGQLPQLLTETYTGGRSINYDIGFAVNSTYIAGGFFDQYSGFWNTASVVSASTGTWYDVVLTYDDSIKQIKVYLNGNPVATTTASGTAFSDGLGLRIARRWDNADYLDCTVKAINIWNGALTPTEVSGKHSPYNSLV